MLMLTTESQAEKKDAGRKASATGWIVNPFDSDQLVAVVQKLVN
jgi:two-component system chemotaxis response regulator CheY